MRPDLVLAAIASGLALTACTEDPVERGEGAVVVNGAVITEAQADVLEQRMDRLESRMERLEQLADIRGGPVADAVTDHAVRRADAAEETADRLEQATDAAEERLAQ